MLEVHLMNRHLNNRAVSQIIAALMLIAITVTAAVLLYVFSIGLLGSLGTGGGQQIKEQLIMEGYNFPPGGPLTLSIRNVGPSSANIGGADFFIGGVKASLSGGTCISATIAPTQTCGATLTLGQSASSLVSGAAYPLKIVTPEGGVFSYPVVYEAGI